MTTSTGRRSRIRNHPSLVGESHPWVARRLRLRFLAPPARPELGVRYEITAASARGIRPSRSSDADESTRNLPVGERRVVGAEQLAQDLAVVLTTIRRRTAGAGGASEKRHGASGIRIVPPTGRRPPPWRPGLGPVRRRRRAGAATTPIAIPASAGASRASTSVNVPAHASMIASSSGQWARRCAQRSGVVERVRTSHRGTVLLPHARADGVAARHDAHPGPGRARSACTAARGTAGSRRGPRVRGPSARSRSRAGAPRPCRPPPTGPNRCDHVGTTLRSRPSSVAVRRTRRRGSSRPARGTVASGGPASSARQRAPDSMRPISAWITTAYARGFAHARSRRTR